MAAEKIRYKDFLDYAERLAFSGEKNKMERGHQFLDLVDEIDKGRAGQEKKSLHLSKNEMELLFSKGFDSASFFAFLKDGKAPEYGSPLIDYQDSYFEYMLNPTKDRLENFEDLKGMEFMLNEMQDLHYTKYAPLARGQEDPTKISDKYVLLKDIPYIKQAAYGRNGFLSKLENVYNKLGEKYGYALSDALRDMEATVSTIDISTNKSNLYATAEFVEGKDGKAELHYSIHAPLISESKNGDLQIKDNEALTFRVTNNGIEGAKYTDLNIYYDDLYVSVKAPNGKITEKTGKKAADYLKLHPNEDYPNPDQIKEIKVDNKFQWVYLLPDMSYPKRGAIEPFTKDYDGIQNSIVSDRLRSVGEAIEIMAIECEKSKVHEWTPKTFDFMRQEPRRDSFVR